MLFLFSGIIILFDSYVFQAFTAALPSSSLITGILFFSTTVLLIAVFWYGNFFKIDRGKNFWRYLFAFISILFFSKFIIFGFLLGEDIYRLVADYNGNSIVRSGLLSRIAIGIAALPFISMLSGLRNVYNYKKRRLTIKLPNLPSAFDGLKIIQISDIHSGSLKNLNGIAKGVSMINEENPDLVFFTGDLVNNLASEMLDKVSIFKEIKAKYGVFSILGNHDYGDYVYWRNIEDKQANFQQLFQIHAAMGWHLLRNENHILTSKDGDLAIIGVENWSAKGHFRSQGDLSKAEQGTHECSVKLLLSHDPTHWEAEVIQKCPTIDITFSGHTHGMQFGIEIPGILKWSPSKWIYKQWAGLYQKGQQYLYVNRGFGVLGYPGRVGILPEITIMTLKKP